MFFLDQNVTNQYKRRMIAETIRKELQKDNRTKAHIAELAAIDPAQLSRFINGKSSISINTADRLCGALNLKLKK